MRLAPLLPLPCRPPIGRGHAAVAPRRARLLTVLVAVAFGVTGVAGALAGPAQAGVDRGQAAPYYDAIESWSSAAALQKNVPGIQRLGTTKPTTDPPSTEQLFSLTFVPARSVTKKNDALIAARLPAGYPTSGLTKELDKLRKAWADPFRKLPGDLSDDDLADVATVSALVGLSVFSGDQKVLTDPRALGVRTAFRQALYGNAAFRGLTDDRKQSAAEMLRIRTLLAYRTYGEERTQKDWQGVRQVRADLRAWMRAGLGVDLAKVELGDQGLRRR